LLALAFSVSMKTSLMALSLGLACIGTVVAQRFAGRRTEAKRLVLYAVANLLGMITMPAVVVLFFISLGVGSQMFSCVISQHPATGYRSSVADEICDPLAGVIADRVVWRLADLEMARDDRAPFTACVHFHGRGFLLQHVSLSLALEGAADTPSILSGDGDYCFALPPAVCGRAVETYARILVHFAFFDRHCRNRVSREGWIAA
jgi:hypothetical protein